MRLGDFFSWRCVPDCGEWFCNLNPFDFPHTAWWGMRRDIRAAVEETSDPSFARGIPVLVILKLVFWSPAGSSP